MSVCWRCGAPVNPNDKFCGVCAAPMAGPGGEQPAHPPPGGPPPGMHQGPPPGYGSPYAQPPVGAPGGPPAAPPGAPGGAYGGPVGGPPGFAAPAGPPMGPPAAPPGAPFRGQPMGPPAVSPTHGAPYGQEPSGPPMGAPPGPPPGMGPTGGPPPGFLGGAGGGPQQAHPGAAGSPYGPPPGQPALADMRIAGSEAFEATALSPHDVAQAQPVGLPPTGAMSPYPDGAPAGAPPPGMGGPPGMDAGAYLGAPPGMDALPAMVGPSGFAGAHAPPGMAPPEPGPPPVQPGFHDTNLVSEAGGGRELRGFLYSFHNDPNGEFWPLFAGENAAGRADSGESLDIPIFDPTTSSRHAVFICDGPNRMVLRDAGSTNGTFVNDQPVGYQGSVEIHDGDRIRLGGYNAAIRFVLR